MCAFAEGSLDAKDLAQHFDSGGRFERICFSEKVGSSKTLLSHQKHLNPSEASACVMCSFNVVLCGFF